MKKTLTAIAVMLTFTANAQLPNDTNTGIAVDLSIGMASNNQGIGRFGLGAVTHFPANTLLHSSVNLLVFSQMRSAYNPVMAEIREGVMIGTWEFYGGMGYHYASYEKNIDNTNGWKQAFGIQKKFKGTPFAIAASSSGRYYSLHFGITAIR